MPSRPNQRWRKRRLCTATAALLLEDSVASLLILAGLGLALSLALLLVLPSQGHLLKPTLSLVV